MIFKINNKYDKHGPSRFVKNACIELDKNKDVPSFIYKLQKGQISNASPEDKKQEIQLRDICVEGKYTDENIDKKYQQSGRRPLAVFSEEALADDKRLFERSLITIQDYFKVHSNKISDRDRFYLSYLSARIHSQLGNHKHCIRHYNNVLNILEEANQEDWAKELSFIKTRIKEKIEKHELMKAGPIFKNSNSLTEEEALASKIYAKKGIIFSSTDLKAFRKTLFSKYILQVSALDALVDNRFSIFLLEQVILKDGKSVIGYNKKNTIRVKKPTKSLDPPLLSTILHELTHYSMDRVFKNDSKPYFENYPEAKKAYRDSMRQIFLNMANAVLPLEELANLECGKKHNIEMQCRQVWKNEYLDCSTTITFPHPWNINLSLDQLIENCFGPDGVLRIPPEIILSTYSVIVNSKKINCNNARYKTFIDNFKALRNSLFYVFVSSYPVEAVDFEFITHVTNNIFCFKCWDADIKNIIKPLIDFIENNINPHMKNYIKGHPAKLRMNF